MSKAQLKDAITHAEKELYASNAKLEWFKYKLNETKCQLGKVNLRASSLEERVCNLDVEVKLQKEVVTQVEDNAMDKGIDVGFKIFRRLLLEIQPNFNMVSLKACLSDEVINEAMDEVEREKAVAKEAASPSGSELGNGIGEGV